MLDIYNQTGLCSKPFPFIGNLEITKNCQLDCKICYNEKAGSKRQLSKQEIFHLVDELCIKGCVYLNITGGEPLTNPDFPEIYSYIAQKGIRPSVESNGIVLTDEILSILCKFPPDKYHISLYSLDSDIYKATTGKLININTITNNILKLKKSGINVVVRSPVSKYNYTKMHEVYDWCKNNELEFRHNTRIFWKQTGEHCINHRCIKDDFIPLLSTHPIYQAFYDELDKMDHNAIRKKDCVSGLLEFNINAFGEMSHCVLFWNQKINILEYGLDYVWDKWFPNFRRPDDDFCLGKVLFGEGDHCPWNEILCNQNINVRKSLSIHFWNEYSKMTEENKKLFLIKYGISDSQCAFLLNDAERSPS
jgi:MoaA/NifB/PqqE/SkfB family radical SAM enzyme